MSSGKCDQTITISVEDYTKLMRDSIELEYQKKWQERVNREKELKQQEDKKGEFEAILREARCKATRKHMSDFLRVRGYEVDKRMDLQRRNE